MFITMRSQFVQRFFPGVNTPIRYNYLLEQIRNNFAFTFTFINNFMEMCYLKHVNPTIFSGRNTTVSRPEVGQSSLINGRACVSVEGLVLSLLRDIRSLLCGKRVLHM